MERGEPLTHSFLRFHLLSELSSAIDETPSSALLPPVLVRAARIAPMPAVRCLLLVSAPLSRPLSLAICTGGDDKGSKFSSHRAYFLRALPTWKLIQKLRKV
jgi:hypothetical protein